jgi:hypothetical protein
MRCQKINVAHTNEPISIRELESLKDRVYNWHGGSYASLFTFHLKIFLESLNFVQNLRHLNGASMGLCGMTMTNSRWIKTLIYLVELI